MTDSVEEKPKLQEITCDSCKLHIRVNTKDLEVLGEALDEAGWHLNYIEETDFSYNVSVSCPAHSPN